MAPGRPTKSDGGADVRLHQRVVKAAIAAKMYRNVTAMVFIDPASL
jgi:hypothetical protein